MFADCEKKLKIFFEELLIVPENWKADIPVIDMGTVMTFFMHIFFLSDIDFYHKETKASILLQMSFMFTPVSGITGLIIVCIGVCAKERNEAGPTYFMEVGGPCITTSSLHLKQFIWHLMQ